MAREIYCHKCGKYVGELRDATLAKGIKFECSNHEGKPGYEEKETNFGEAIFDLLKGRMGNSNP